MTETRNIVVIQIIKAKKKKKRFCLQITPNILKKKTDCTSQVKEILCRRKQNDSR